MTEGRHRGRTALVTGAGSGIGRAIASRLADEGCAVACADIDSESAQATVTAIVEGGGRAIGLGVDVRDRAQVQSAVSQIATEFRSLNYLVNNAGVVTMNGLDTLTDEEWDFVLDVNLKGQFIVAQVAASLLRASKPACIVNMSTIEADVVVSSTGHCQPHYNASKGGVKMLTKALAVELAADQIRVNAVAPGPVETGFIPGRNPADPVPESVMERLLIPRLAQPEDIAAAVSFLLSDDASFITGTQLAVDGGWTAR